MSHRKLYDALDFSTLKGRLRDAGRFRTPRDTSGTVLERMAMGQGSLGTKVNKRTIFLLTINTSQQLKKIFQEKRNALVSSQIL